MGMQRLLLVGLILGVLGCNANKTPTAVVPKSSSVENVGGDDARAPMPPKIVPGSGSGRNAILQQPFDQAAKIVMLNIGKAYELALVDKPPKNHDDLGQPQLWTKRDLQKKEIEVLYGVDPKKLGEEAPNRMLAWEKEPDADGGRMVLMADCKSVKYLSENEFQRTPKAK
jgi:hypothetical protein